ncbi:MAG: hypothetical protein A4E48_00017 [Methanosaeta sp. PtaU1.Bin060]|jgi:hypothetical protein|nr:hypothetical protein [Candidatus Methanosuratincola sp.]MDM7911912.1 hypothetical protein [Methanotrichaceae archaeon]OPY55490.1 MAG: hypothetical protein A4E48_00017 [Methanosaeta sp. PtaU1.Bin060]
MGRSRISVTVSEEAKEVLVGYQMDHRIKTRDDAMESLLRDYGKLSQRVKELEAQLAEKGSK